MPVFSCVNCCENTDVGSAWGTPVDLACGPDKYATCPGREIAGAFGVNGGNPSAVILPEPIEYQTNTLDVSLGYVGQKAQFQLAYALSLFNNDESTLNFQNPYSEAGRGAPWASVTSFPTGFGQFALPPDNQAHRVTFSGGYNLGLTTRSKR